MSTETLYNKLSSTQRNNNFDTYNLSYDPFSLFPVVNQFEGVCVYLCVCTCITHVNMCKFVFEDFYVCVWRPENSFKRHPIGTLY